MKLLGKCLIVIAVVAAGVFLAWEPWRLYLEKKPKAEAATAAMREAEARASEAERRRSRANTPLGREELARERGQVREGETLLELRDGS